MTQKKRQRWMKRADDAFSKYIRSRGYCQSDRTSHAGNLQCAHIVPRTYKTVRTDERNALCLCAGCHTYFTHRPLEWRTFIDIEYPDLLSELEADALSYRKVDWKEQAEYWETRVD